MFIFMLCAIGSGIIGAMLLLISHAGFKKRRTDSSAYGALAQIATALVVYTSSLSLAFDIGDGHDFAHGLHRLLVFLWVLVGLGCIGIQHWKTKRSDESVDAQ